MEHKANIVHEQKNDRILIPPGYRTDWRWRQAAEGAERGEPPPSPPRAPFCRGVVDARKSGAPEAWGRLQEQFPHAYRALETVSVDNQHDNNPEERST